MAARIGRAFFLLVLRLLIWVTALLAAGFISIALVKRCSSRSDVTSTTNVAIAGVQDAIAEFLIRRIQQPAIVL